MADRARTSDRASRSRAGQGPAPAPADGRRQQLHGSGPADLWLRLQRQAGNRAVGRWWQAGQQARDGRTGDAGLPLPDDVRADLEAGVGVPLRDVRVHTDPGAADLAARLGARAFTVGTDVYFGGGEYDPASAAGYRLLAHEVAHTVQRPAGAPGGSRTVEHPAAPAERQAEQAADRLAAARSSTRSRPPGPAVAPVDPAVHREAVAQRLPDPSLDQSLPEAHQSLLGEQEPEPDQSLPGEPAPAATPAESAAEERGLGPDETDTLDRIRDLACQRWVGPFDEAEIEELWEGFGDRLPRVAASDPSLWQRCADVGADLDELPQVTRLQEQFVDDVRQLVSGYLVLNRGVVLDEIHRLGLAGLENSSMPAPDEFQTEQTRELQDAARSLAGLQTAQAKAREAYVGYQVRTSSHPVGGEWTTWEPVRFDPYAPPQVAGGLGTGLLDHVMTPGVRVPVVSYAEISVAYDAASDTISDLIVRFPALSALTREGSTHVTAAVTAGFAELDDPQQARRHLATGLQQVLRDIEATRVRLEDGRLDPLDLTPVHRQLFAGLRGRSGVAWDEMLPRWAAVEQIGDHHFEQALEDLGLQTAAAALFMLAPLTGGASLALVLGGLAVTGLKFHVSQQRYETFAEAARTGVTPGTDLVSPPQVEAAELTRDADAVALALALVAAGTATTARAAASIRGRMATPKPDRTSTVGTTPAVEGSTPPPVATPAPAPASAAAAQEVQAVPTARIRFSQEYPKEKGRHVEAIASSMRRDGWRGDPIDVVRMPDGQLTSLDNTRVLAAHRAGIDVQARVHAFAEPITDPVQVNRFTTSKGVPMTWGEAALLRIGKQSSAYRTRYPHGSMIFRSDF
jgi:hypothetical protein